MPATSPFAIEATVPASTTDYVLFAAKSGRTIQVEEFVAGRGATTTLRSKPAGAASNLTTRKWSKQGDTALTTVAGEALTVSTGSGSPVLVRVVITER